PRWTRTFPPPTVARHTDILVVLLRYCSRELLPRTGARAAPVPRPHPGRLNQPCFPQELLRHVAGISAMAVDLVIEPCHRDIVYGTFQLPEYLAELGILFKHLGTHNQPRVVRREQLPVVLQHDEVQGSDLAVGREGDDQVDLP